jgi:hypothetical protein
MIATPFLSSKSLILSGKIGPQDLNELCRRINPTETLDGQAADMHLFCAKLEKSDKSGEKSWHSLDFSHPAVSFHF